MLMLDNAVGTYSVFLYIYLYTYIYIYINNMIFEYDLNDRNLYLNMHIKIITNTNIPMSIVYRITWPERLTNT